jgi:hypothetical protein
MAGEFNSSLKLLSSTTYIFILSFLELEVQHEMEMLCVPSTG